jgi:hypothetical protein
MSINPYESPSESPSPEPGPDAENTVLRFDLETEDLDAFQWYHYKHSWLMRKARYRLLGILAVPMFLANLLLFSEFSWLPQFAFSLMLAAVFIALLAVLYRWAHFRQIRVHMRHMDLSGLICEHELRLEETFLMEVTTVNVSRHAYDRIHSIEESADHAFIFISPIQAHVIPKQRVLQGDLTRFLTELRRRIDAVRRRLGGG